ncbi:hypothetical protein [Halosolutus gelatinilyticus]|uniref:hypothetical protein n=1 Tax=Halosolutus gelatinilyticus TaxID=2931975 RepID=UPI001FF2B54C|nr:hypothetical protein [Halosolutus gelatinilyticus]
MRRVPIARLTRVGSYVLASVIAVLLVVFPIIRGLGVSTPVSLIAPLAEPIGVRIPVPGDGLKWGLFVGFPLLVLGRAITTRAPADAVLATWAIPCLFLSLWALYRPSVGRSALFWGDPIMLLGNVLLALVVLGDGFLAHVRGLRAPTIHG